MPDPTVSDKFDPHTSPQQFLLRVWREDLAQGHFEWRGRVQHIGRGEVRYFRDWQALIACLQAMVGDSSDHLQGI